jgi:hypothetical protein
MMKMTIFKLLGQGVLWVDLPELTKETQIPRQSKELDSGTAK